MVDLDHRQKAPQLNWSIAQWPCHKTCDNVDAPECLLILRGAPDPDASWLAIRGLLSPELDLQLAGPRGALPVYEENLDRGIFATDPAFKAYARIGRARTCARAPSSTGTRRSRARSRRSCRPCG